VEESRTSSVPPTPSSVDGQRGVIDGWVGFKDAINGSWEGTTN